MIFLVPPLPQTLNKSSVQKISKLENVSRLTNLHFKSITFKGTQVINRDEGGNILLRLLNDLKHKVMSTAQYF